MYRAVTRQIEVTVEPNFLPERSSVDRGQYFWSYTIVITNTGAETVQLRTRHWIITDATGRKQEVRGEGVVGEQPVLAPGERFEYTSGVPLPTASGFMTGRYQMVSESGERFEIDVPTFSLHSPDNRRVLNLRQCDLLRATDFPGHRSLAVIASEAKQSMAQQAERWIASRSLSSGAHSRDPLARQDG